MFRRDQNDVSSETDFVAQFFHEENQRLVLYHRFQKSPWWPLACTTHHNRRAEDMAHRIVWVSNAAFGGLRERHQLKILSHFQMKVRRGKKKNNQT